MEKILTKTKLSDWVRKLSGYQVYWPLKAGDHWSYELLAETDPVALDGVQTRVSVKKLVFPQREVFMQFCRSCGDESEADIEIVEQLPAEDAVVVFGVRPCEAKGIALLEQVFTGDFPDPYFQRRREALTVVGFACNHPPGDNCFCTSVEGAPHSHDGCDALITDLGDEYFIEAFSPKGEQLLSQGGGLLNDPSAGQRDSKSKLHKESERELKRELKDARGISSKLSNLFDAEIWDHESLNCLRCGICTYLCPTCHCFDINDELSSNAPVKGERIRTWDNCQFPDFTMHSSGHNPRPQRASRLRQRLFHKFRYFVDHYNQFQCTGCGRCVSQCPVGIDIIEVLNKVRDHEQ